MIGQVAFHDLVTYMTTFGTTKLTMTIPESLSGEAWFSKSNSHVIVNNRMVHLPKVEQIVKRNSSKYPYILLIIEMENIECNLFNREY